MKLLWQCIAIGIAGSLGALARFGVQMLCNRLPTTFPVGTLVINLSGSLLLGWFMGAAGSRLAVSETMRVAIGVGFIGAYTTFSTFMYESHLLLKHEQTFQATLNLVGSVVLGLVAVQLGARLAGR